MLSKISGVIKPTKSTNELIDMHLAKIKDGYMFKTNKPEKEHTYAVYTDLQSKEVRAVPTTHLYVVDEDKMDKVRKGLLRKVKFAGYETPSCVENYYFADNIYGSKIDLNDKKFVSVDKTPLSQNQASIIKNFAKYRRKRK